jgi:hypothetical protein
MTVETRSASEAEPGALDVRGPGAQALVVGQARGGGAVVVGAHERVHVTIATLEQTPQQLLPDEPGRAGE